MKVDLSRYSGLTICVALSGGRDSIALAHYLSVNAGGQGIKLFALNCEHGLRGDASKRDSAFVEKWCASTGIPLLKYEKDCLALAENLRVGVEEAARVWRRECYLDAAKKLGAAIATAHHANDNAETVLFNIARGAALSGACAIGDAELAGDDGFAAKIVRPLIGCTRAEIDEYIAENRLEFVEDESNQSQQFTRNYIRFNALSQLEKAVPAAVKGIYRFSRLAAEDEGYFKGLIERENLVEGVYGGVKIKSCGEKVIFRRAALIALKTLNPDIKDYTFEQFERLFAMQSAENGKKFEFLSLVAFKDGDGIYICKGESLKSNDYSLGLREYLSGNCRGFCGVKLQLTPEYAANNEVFEKFAKALKLDLDKVPSDAVIRFRRAGDVFEKFGGGTKSLGDFLTDKKIPIYLRERIPLICDGSRVLVVCGVEIAERVKITPSTKNVLYILS